MAAESEHQWPPEFEEISAIILIDQSKALEKRVTRHRAIYSICKHFVPGFPAFRYGMIKAISHVSNGLVN